MQTQSYRRRAIAGDFWIKYGYNTDILYLNDRQKQIRDFIADNQPVKISDLAKQFPMIQTSTLKKDLQYLRDEQLLTMIGQGKGSIYVLKEKG